MPEICFLLIENFLSSNYENNYDALNDSFNWPNTCVD